MLTKRLLPAALSLCLLAGAIIPTHAEETANQQNTPPPQTDVINPSASGNPESEADPDSSCDTALTEPDTPVPDSTAPAEPDTPVLDDTAPAEADTPVLDDTAPAEPDAPDLDDTAPAEPDTPVLAESDTAVLAEILDSGTLGNNITWTLDSEGTLTVSGEGGIYKPSDEFPWMNLDIRHVAIQNGVTSIGPHTFYGCRKLATIHIAETVTEISTDAFQNCVSLKEIDIPASVTRFGQRPFEGCTSLGRITVALDNPNFYSDAGVLIRKEGTAWLNREPYAYVVCCPAAYPNSSYQIPEHVTHIWQNAFENCKNLTNVLIPNSVTEIQGNAFRGCAGLTSVTLSANITDFASTVFQDCPNLAAVHISPGNPVYSSKDGLVLETRNGETTLVYCPGAFKRNNYRIPNGIDHIDRDAFNGCTGLTGSLTIPGDVKTIGSCAFEDCTGLSGSLTLENGVQSIDVYAFEGCNGLSSVSIPASVTSIEARAFTYTGIARFTVNSNSSAYTDIDGVLFSKDRTQLICCPSKYPFRESFYEVPSGVEFIKNCAFGGCHGLTRIGIPVSVQKIGYIGLMTSNENTTSILYAGNAAQWNRINTNDGGEWLSEELASGSIRIYYSGQHPEFYEVKVINSHKEPTGAGWYPAGTEIHFQAGEWPGHRFSGWTLTGANLWTNPNNPNNPIAFFVMPANAVTAVANWGNDRLTYTMGTLAELEIERDGNLFTVKKGLSASQTLWIVEYSANGKMRSLHPLKQNGASYELSADQAKYNLICTDTNLVPKYENLILTE